MSLVTSSVPIVRATVLICSLFLIAVADGRNALAQQPVIRDHRDTAPTPQVRDHRDQKETRPGYRWTGTHWERVQAPPKVVPPPIAPKGGTTVVTPTPSTPSNPQPPDRRATAYCSEQRNLCRAKCAAHPKNVIPFWISVCLSDCNKSTARCKY